MTASRRHRYRHTATVTGVELDVAITGLGTRGDGIAETPRGRAYVPDALPGERLRIRPIAQRGDGFAAAIVDRLSESPDRVAPDCPHFGACGGCAAQHLAPPAYADWKRGLVVGALARRGLGATPVAALCRTDPAGRRRAKLAAMRTRGGEVVVGFRAAASHRIVDVQACLVLRPPLLRLLPPLRGLLPAVVRPGETVDLLLTETATGIDLLVTAPRPPDQAAFAALAEFAGAEDLARVAWTDTGRTPAAAEPIALRRAPSVTVGGVPLSLPAGAFLQASEAAAGILAETVVSALAGAARVVDLYAGCGTFALAVASAHPRARVHAVDSSDAAVRALQTAAGAAALGGHVTAACRDLARQPLQADELKRFDAAVFDPPRAGAAEQAEQLARSAIAILVAVSCNPATFARDARTLTDGGYRLDTVLPVDQFVYSHQVELVGVFRRAP